MSTTPRLTFDVSRHRPLPFSPLPPQSDCHEISFLTTFFRSAHTTAGPGNVIERKAPKRLSSQPLFDRSHDNSHQLVIVELEAGVIGMRVILREDAPANE